MKNHFLFDKHLPKADAFFRPGIWLLFHAALIITLTVSICVSGRLHINTNLFDILPDTKNLKSVAIADKILRGKSGRQIVVLAASESFKDAKQAAVSLYETLCEKKYLFENIALYVDSSTVEQVQEYFFDNRFVLLNSKDCDALQNGDAKEFANDALGSLFGIFTFYTPPSLETDPFMLANRSMTALMTSGILANGAMSLHDGVLACDYKGKSYVMLRATLASSGMLEAGSKNENAVQLIYSSSKNIISSNTLSAASGTLEFVFSGAPFHSFESSTSAQKEISLISSISLVIIVILFVLVFHSLLPALLSAGAVMLSLISATAATLLIFGEIHVITFVFGTTLIGTCVDYSIHYFVHKNNENGTLVIKRIFKALSNSLLSTEICFAVLLLAPFTLLRQFAVFSMAGLFSSFLTVVCTFPKITFVPHDIPFMNVFSKIRKISFRPKRLILTVAALCAILTIFNHKNISIENNIGNLYTPPPVMAENEKRTALVMKTGAAACYFIVKGDTLQELLVNEEEFRHSLDSGIENGSLSHYLATSIFVPSMQTQKESYNAAKLLLPLTDDQIAAIDIPTESAAFYKKEFENAKDKFVTPDSKLPSSIHDIISYVYLGKIESKYFSCILPLNVTDENALSLLANGYENIVFINKVKDINTGLNTLTRIMILLFAAAYIIILIFVHIIYSKDNALRICSVPPFIALVILAAFSMLNISFSFFSFIGILLAMGLGLDYIFYITENKKDGIAFSEQHKTVVGIILSFATTFLSFGALSLSNFAPVHIFATSVFVGLTAAFFISMSLAHK
ncbi:MAG: MMPL family transporter [Termitinemataceae bacterium]|nr:MAG: MMPL family transporter [Termitinemataceae bacterium]